MPHQTYPRLQKSADKFVIMLWKIQLHSLKWINLQGSFCCWFFFLGEAPEVENVETRKTGMKVLKTGEYNCRGEEHHHLSSMGTE